MSLVELGKLAKYIRGITFKPTDVVEPFTDGSVVCMRTKNIQADLDDSDLMAVNSSFVKREEQYLKKGDLLVSSANSWNLVGKICYIHELPYRATAGGFISILRPGNKVDSRYLYHWLNSPKIQHEVRLCGRQTTNISNLDRERFLKIKAPLPPIEEQRRIAAILDQADAIRRKRQEAIRLTEELLRATFLDMFGDPVTNPKGWEIGLMRQVVKDTQYGTSQKSNEKGEGLPVLRMNNITYLGKICLDSIKWCCIDPKDEEKFTVQSGDLLFNRTNSPELVGKTAIWKENQKFAYAGYLVRVRFHQSKANPEYVSAYLNSNYGKKYLVVHQIIVGKERISCQLQRWSVNPARCAAVLL